MDNQYKISILRPGGNDTALVKGVVKKEQRRAINDNIMQAFPNVEQVGFYEFDGTKNAVLEMAGGEFCGNATRSLAYLLLKGRPGQMKITVSGTRQQLIAGVNSKNNAFAYMPIFTSFNAIQQLKKELTLVELEGITHVITYKPKNSNKAELKNMAKKILTDNKLFYSRLAAGVMFIEEALDCELTVDPIVWVRDIGTFFYETACASGTTAIGLSRARPNTKNLTELQVKQPSGEWINVTVKKNDKAFTEAVIDGPITLLKVSS